MTVLEVPNHVDTAPENQSVFLESVTASADNDASQYGDPHGRNEFYAESPDKRLLVIATPFRKGRHVAKRPVDFLPIIEHLEMIHKAGYVHGDIRAFNTVFGNEEGGRGCLIDFDFSGKMGEVFYPDGYKPLLDDGFRDGKGGKEIKAWHDWHALGSLIFVIHELDSPDDESGNDSELTVKFFKSQKYWMRVNDDVPQNKIDELKGLLKTLDEKDWTVQPWSNFKDSLEETHQVMGPKRVPQES